jgi:hypothetical protein
MEEEKKEVFGLPLASSIQFFRIFFNGKKTNN